MEAIFWIVLIVVMLAWLVTQSCELYRMIKEILS